MKEWRALKVQLLELGKVVDEWRFMEHVCNEAGSSYYPPRESLHIYARHHCPESYSKQHGVESKAFSAHAITLRDETIPAIKARFDRLNKDRDEMIRSIEAPLDEWVTTGEF